MICAARPPAFSALSCCYILHTGLLTCKGRPSRCYLAADSRSLWSVRILSYFFLNHSIGRYEKTG